MYVAASNPVEGMWRKSKNILRVEIALSVEWYNPDNFTYNRDAFYTFWPIYSVIIGVKWPGPKNLVGTSTGKFLCVRKVFARIYKIGHKM